MTGLVDAAFSRIRVVVTAFVLVIVSGLAAFHTIPREAEPDIAAPFVGISLGLPGISPEDAARLLIRPTELELQSIEGIRQMDAIAYDGSVQFILEFETVIDIEQAVLDVREAVDRAQGEYPEDADEPVINEFNLQNQFPILTAVLYGGVPERTLYRAARRLEDRLASLPGVLEVNLTGVREELLEIVVDPLVLESYGLTEIEVVNAVSMNNGLVTAGSLIQEDGIFTVKIPGLIKTAEDLDAVPVRVEGDSVITVGDIAKVRRTFKDRTGYALFNGQPSIGIEISKRVGSNIVETINGARRVVEDESRSWSSSIRYSFISDQSLQVRDNLDGLTASIITAIILVMIVVIGALDMRSALLVGISIPTSFLMAFIFLDSFGYTLNMMVMFGLILAVGMLVDGSIVIVEYADRRMAEGTDRRAAYMEAAKRMFWPVITSTGTTLAAFLPFMFWQGTVGEFMRYLPLTMIFVLTSSFLVAIFVLPVLGTLLRIPLWMKKTFNLKGKTDISASASAPVAPDGITQRYVRFISAAVRRPLLVTGGTAVTVVLCMVLFWRASPDVEFFIRDDNEQVNLLVLGRGNLSPYQEIEAAREVASRFEGHPAIEHIYIQTGPALSRNSSLPQETIAQVGIDLVDYSMRAHSRVILEEFRDLVQDIPGFLVEVRQREGGPPVGKDVEVEISSLDFEAMLEAGRKLRHFMENDVIASAGADVHTFMDQEDSLPLPGIEWSMDVDRAMAGRYGLTVQEAGAVLQLVAGGLLVDKYRPDDSDDEIDIRARYPEEKRDIFALDSVRVQTDRGSVPLSNFVTRKARPQLDRVIHRDGRRIIEVKGNANTRIKGHEISQDRAIARTREWLDTGVLGTDVQWVMRGADEETREAAEFFKGAMLAAMFMIAIILLLEFNSFYHSFLTLLSVIFSVFGVLLGVALTGQYISLIMTGTGIVALAGIVVNNNIVLIDTFQHLRRQGMALEEAVVRTAAERMRPVLLTTVTTILGLLPMVLELNVDFSAGTISRGSSTSDWWVLLSSAVVYGLAFSTVLTLVFTPVMIAAPAVIGKRAGNIFSGLSEYLEEKNIRLPFIHR